MKQLKKLIKKKGISFREIARKTGINVSTISRIVSGETENPLYKTVEAIKEAVK